MKSNKGFTLIELLVVIAIIGILSSVVLASLNTARDKGADAAIKSNLNGIRAQAEIVYDGATPNSYNSVCENPNVTGALTAARQASGGTAICRDGSNDGTADSWAVLAQLKTAGYYCIDYKGNATTSATTIGADNTEAKCQ